MGLVPRAGHYTEAGVLVTQPHPFASTRGTASSTMPWANAVLALVVCGAGAGCMAMIDSAGAGCMAMIDSGLVGSGRGTARAEDAQGIPTQSHVSPSILVYKDTG